MQLLLNSILLCTPMLPRSYKKHWCLLNDLFINKIVTRWPCKKDTNNNRFNAAVYIRVTEMMGYSGVSYLFWEWKLLWKSQRLIFSPKIELLFLRKKRASLVSVDPHPPFIKREMGGGESGKLYVCFSWLIELCSYKCLYSSIPILLWFILYEDWGSIWLWWIDNQLWSI